VNLILSCAREDSGESMSKAITSASFGRRVKTQILELPKLLGNNLPFIISSATHFSKISSHQDINHSVLPRRD
jgi:hypothetical protein